METIKSTHRLVLAVLQFLNSKLTLWQIGAAVLSYIYLKQTFWGGLHLHQWLNVLAGGALQYLQELMKNVPLIGALFS